MTKPTTQTLHLHDIDGQEVEVDKRLILRIDQDSTRQGCYIVTHRGCRYVTEDIKKVQEALYDDQ